MVSLNSVCCRVCVVQWYRSTVVSLYSVINHCIININIVILITTTTTAAAAAAAAALTLILLISIEKQHPCPIPKLCHHPHHAQQLTALLRSCTVRHNSSLEEKHPPPRTLPILCTVNQFTTQVQQEVMENQFFPLCLDRAAVAALIHPNCYLGKVQTATTRTTTMKINLILRVVHLPGTFFQRTYFC